MSESSKFVKLPCFDEEYVVTSELGVKFGGTNLLRPKHDGVDYGTPIGESYKAWLDKAKVVQQIFKVPSLGDPSVKVEQLETWVYDGDYTIKSLHFEEHIAKSGKHNKGDLLSLTGNSGRSTGPHTHISVTYGKHFLNKVVIHPNDYFLLYKDMEEENPLLYVDKITYNDIQIIVTRGQNTKGIFYLWSDMNSREHPSKKNHSVNPNGKGFIQLKGETEYMPFLEVWKDKIILTAIGVDTQFAFKWYFDFSSRTFKSYNF